MSRAVRRAAFLVLGAVLALPAQGTAQSTPPELLVEREDRTVERIRVVTDRGYAGLPLSVLQDLGWSAQESGSRLTLSAGSRAELTLDFRSPFFHWGGTPLQFADPPYRDGNDSFVPLQLVTDFFPERLPELYEYDSRASTLRAGDARQAGQQAPSRPAPQVTPPSAARPATPALRAPNPPMLDRPSPYDGVRVVWIDAGHGGADPGAIGLGGLREKDVALGISRRLERILRNERGIEVRMTREDDAFIDLWERGLLATDAKGERPGVFVSVHANSYPVRRTTRGFETYFLSEARTEDERRVSANENAPLTIRGRGVDPARQSDLDFILRELRNFDHAHWSALLAQMIQDEMAKFHPGPNRGVKQGPLAVLTNAIMPSVLVEVGFVSNEEEARLMAQDQFQDRAASAIAAAVLRFLERYPPGSGLGGSR